MYTWGGNSHGELGDDTDGCRESLGDSVASNAVAIAAGLRNTLVVGDDGKVYACGANECGQLGRGTAGSSSNQLQAVKKDASNDLTGIVAVACGYAHCLALDEDGHVWAWGSNGAGELGQDHRDSPCYIAYATQVLDSEGEDPLSNIIAIAAGYQSSYAVASIGLSTSWPEDSNQDDLDWVYQNTQTTTQDRHKTVLTITPDDQNGNTSYTVSVTKESGDGDVTIQSTASSLVWDIVGGRRTDGTTGTGTATLKVTVQGDVGGYNETTVTVKVRQLGDVTGNDVVNIDDLSVIQDYLNSFPVSQPDEALDLTGDGNINIDDKSVCQDVINGIPIP